MLRGSLRLSRQPCRFYCRLGRCRRHERGQCPHVHDPALRPVCTRHLQEGGCKRPGCPYNHEPRPEKVPHCLHFLMAECRRERCPYQHVNVDADAPLCAKFLAGFCPRGQQVSCLWRAGEGCLQTLVGGSLRIVLSVASRYMFPVCFTPYSNRLARNEVQEYSVELSLVTRNFTLSGNLIGINCCYVARAQTSHCPFSRPSLPLRSSVPTNTCTSVPSSATRAPVRGVPPVRWHTASAAAVVAAPPPPAPPDRPPRPQRLHAAAAGTTSVRRRTRRRRTPLRRGWRRRTRGKRRGVERVGSVRPWQRCPRSSPSQTAAVTKSDVIAIGDGSGDEE